MSWSRTRQGLRDVPDWAQDDLVLRLLEDNGLRLQVVYDNKYLSGLRSKPLIVIERKGREKRRGRP